MIAWRLALSIGLLLLLAAALTATPASGPLLTEADAAPGSTPTRVGSAAQRAPATRTPFPTCQGLGHHSDHCNTPEPTQKPKPKQTPTNTPSPTRTPRPTRTPNPLPDAPTNTPT